AQRPGRRGAVVPGDRVLPGAAAAGPGGVHGQLRRRAARPAQAGEPEGLVGEDAAVLRPPPEGGAAAGVDGEGYPVPRPRPGDPDDSAAGADDCYALTQPRRGVRQQPGGQPLTVDGRPSGADRTSVVVVTF